MTDARADLLADLEADLAALVELAKDVWFELDALAAGTPAEAGDRDRAVRLVADVQMAAEAVRRLFPPPAAVEVKKPTGKGRKYVPGGNLFAKGV